MTAGRAKAEPVLIVRSPMGVAAPMEPAKVIEPAEPDLMVRFWAPSIVPPPEVELIATLAPSALPPELVESIVTAPPRVILSSMVIVPPLVMTLAAKVVPLVPSPSPLIANALADPLKVRDVSEVCTKLPLVPAALIVRPVLAKSKAPLSSKVTTPV